MIGSRAWWALMRRNFIYRKRNWLGTFFELALPIAFVAILLAIKNAVKNTEGFKAELVDPVYPESSVNPLTFRDYLTAIQANHTCKQVTGHVGFNITGVPKQGKDWMVPFVKCDSRRCVKDSEDAQDYCQFGIIGVSGSAEDDAGGDSRADDFTAWLYEEYPALTTKMPFEHDIVKKFKDPQDMEKYVKDVNYGKTEYPKIIMGVVFQGNAVNDYKYTLRQNSTNFNSPESEWRPAVPTTPDTGRLFKNYAKNDNDVCIPEDGTAKQGWLEESCTGQYMYNAILTFQRLVGDFILHDSGASGNGYTVAEAGVSFAPFPTFAYEESGFFEDIGEMVALFVCLGLLYPVAAMISYITREEEQGQKELIKMMSATESDIGWSWFWTFFLFNLLSATVVSGVSQALFSKSEGIYLWIFWVSTFLSMTVLSMFLSTLVCKSTRAVMIGLLIFFIGVFVTFAVDVSDGSTGLIGFISLHPVSAFSFALTIIGQLEDQDIGLQSSSVGSSDTASGVTFNDCLRFLILDSIIYGVLTWYLNRTRKSGYGQALPLWFPFTRSYWCPNSISPHATGSQMLEAELRSSIPFEIVDRRQGDEKDDIEIHNLRKTYGKKHAVDGLSLTMYNGQVTALLGHNGAGKTTTLQLLTGAISPTDGYATIAGKDIRRDLASIRQDIGICPQHDCLFPNLTVKEHIQFFARLKGTYSEKTPSEAEDHVNQAIQDIALSEKSNTLAKQLSGGMMRKLHVAIAFCGGSKSVVLDEPTSGMDPFSRRFTWDVIRHYRENRCIILTTHFMDEADILGDRIAIMAEGQLRCVGSPLFLKKTYGVGYQLTIEKSQGQKSDEGKQVGNAKREDQEVQFEDADDKQETDDKLRDVVRSSVPEATPLSNTKAELRYQLPIASAPSFAQMFHRLDEAIQQGEISSYGVGITTLEEVFLAVARGDTHEKNSLASSVMNLDCPTINVSDDERSRSSAHSAMDLEKDGLFLRHVGALLRKRAANFRRDKRAWLCTAILPSLFVLIGFIITEYAGVNRNLEPIVLTMDDYNPGVDLSLRNPVSFNAPGNYTCQPGSCAYDLSTTLGTDEPHYFCGAQASLGPNVTCSITDSVNIMKQINDDGVSPQGVEVESVLESSYSLNNTSSAYAASQYGAIFFTHDSASVTSDGDTYKNAVVDECSNKNDFRDTEYCKNFGGIGFVIQYNHTALHASPLYQALADEAIAREALGEPEFSIECTIDPLPPTSNEASYGKAEDTFMAWFLIVVSFPFIAGAFGTFVVVERQSKAKHLQTVAGVEPRAYWISTWLWDIMNYMIPFVITVLLMLAFDVTALTTTDRGVVGGVIVLLLLFGPAAASFSYCLSFAFESAAMCNMFIIISGFLIGMGGPVAIWILHIIGEGGDRNDPNEALLNAANIVAWCLRFFPTFCLSNGVYNAIYIEAWEYWEGEPLTVWTDPILRIETLYLAGQAVLYLVLATYLDRWSTNPRMVSSWRKFKRFITCQCCCFSKSSGPTDVAAALPEDDDVIQEQNRVARGAANDDLIVINEMTKVYENGKVAVKNLSLGIAPGECFGLLGINGAGKTTTLQILTAEFPPTQGDATLAGYSVSNEPEKTRRRIGYCPQFDAHFENMTGREHVELYASIKGVPKEFVKTTAAACLAEVGLSPEDSDRLSSHYSGGMKRRLSLACALVGRPEILFLDECTTGVDPVARRDIWQVISDMVTADNEKKPAVILTTHSMEECEALCPRIGIMANGRLRCLGSAQHLKTRFGQGFQIEMKVDVIDKSDDDYVVNARKLLSLKGTKEDEGDEEAPASDQAEVIFFHMVEALEALHSLTGDNFLADMITSENPIGYNIWKDATSVTGCPLDELAAFATSELRLRTVEDFMKDTYPEFVLRERQDSKVRYEVPSEGILISSIFASIEKNKGRLRLSDYGVSQTSLEQVFVHHAQKAEKLKQGLVDG